MSSKHLLANETIITKKEATRLDQLIQVLEISFIFLLCFMLITLFDSALLDGRLDLYSYIANDFLGQQGFGSLDGGNFGEIVRVTLVFNLMLFSISLIFGLWMRKTRDNWTWNQLGYTFRTPKYSFVSLVRRGIVLGLIGIVVFLSIMTPVIYFVEGGDFLSAFLVHAYHKEGILFTAHQLNAEYYFGFIEMGFIWPLSAGFFFFAYVHNSLKARFPVGVANLVSSTFYVIYLAFFFMVQENDKLMRLSQAIMDPIFWAMFFSFFILLYISFSAFAETKSVVLPFLLNFVFNGVLTLIKAFNSLFFSSTPSSSYQLMLIPYFLLIILICSWYFLNKEDFSTIRLGLIHLREIFSKKAGQTVSLVYIFILIMLFFSFSFFIPGILEHIVVNLNSYSAGFFALINALVYLVLLGLVLVVLTYEPTKVYDVLLVKSPEGIPIVSRQKLFQSDEVLISGFFQAISSVSQELDDDQRASLRSIRRGEREILIEDGVFTRIIALVDREQSRIRNSMIQLQRKFETAHSKVLTSWIGDRSALPEANDLVKS
ncbi:MAG: hypothetical protein ACFE8U_04245, partial [Candidatus Hermodarchaeota archaeon]